MFKCHVWWCDTSSAPVAALSHLRWWTLPSLCAERGGAQHHLFDGTCGDPATHCGSKTVIGFSGGYHEIVYDCIAKKMHIPKNNQWAPPCMIVACYRDPCVSCRFVWGSLSALRHTRQCTTTTAASSTSSLLSPNGKCAQASINIQCSGSAK